MPTRDLINQYVKKLSGLEGQVSGYNPDVVTGLYGEQARMSQMVGSGIAAGSGGVRGTMNKLPLFAVGAEFAEKRMMARNAAQQARLLNLMRISDMWRDTIGLYGQNDMFKLQEDQFKFQKDQSGFNWGDLLGLVNVGITKTI